MLDRLTIVIDQDDFEIAQGLTANTGQCVFKQIGAVVGGEDDGEKTAYDRAMITLLQQCSADSINACLQWRPNLCRVGIEALTIELPDRLCCALHACTGRRVIQAHFKNLGVLAQRPVTTIETLGYLPAMHPIADAGLA